MIAKILYLLLSIAGSIGLFLFGMKMMSDALQSLGGRRMRRFLEAMTSSTSRGLLSGFTVTSLLQSSSAITLLTVSFVSAGFLSLNGAAGIIFGANIGTTITGWLVALLGFRIKMTVLALPLLGIAFPLLLTRNPRSRKSGEFLVGFSLLFLGLMFLSSVVPDFKEMPALHDFLARQTGKGFLSLLFFATAGMLFTMIVQSSSATMAFTVVLAVKGWIGIDMAAAMIIGENIGTTFTANIAALVANRQARIAARFHFLINLLGSIWALLLIHPLMSLSKLLITEFSGHIDPVSPLYISSVLALFHSSFNILNTGLLIGFTPALLKIASFMVRSRVQVSTRKRFKLQGTWKSTPELAMLQVRNEVMQLARLVREMFSLVPELLNEKKERKYDRLFSSIRLMETETDEKERSISRLIANLGGQSISLTTSRHINAYWRIIDDLESIGDAAFIMANHIDEKNRHKLWFTQEIRDNLDQAFRTTIGALDSVIAALANAGHPNATMQHSNHEDENVIREFRDALAKGKLHEEVPKDSARIYDRLLELSERVAHYAYNVHQQIGDILPSRSQSDA